MTNIVKGSLAAVAKQEGQSLAESFMSADAIVIVDVSGSMGACDVDPAPTMARVSWDGPTPQSKRRTRFEAACEELATLQASIPGKVAVVAFSDDVRFVWGGKPPFMSGGTDMAAALQFVEPADGCGMRLVLISDGEPNDPAATLTVARGFTSPIDTVFVGPEGGRGAAFLRQLSSLAGGQSATKTIPQLAAHIAGLISEKAA
jgi:hypothetical protein